MPRPPYGGALWSESLCLTVCLSVCRMRLAAAIGFTRMAGIPVTQGASESVFN